MICPWCFHCGAEDDEYYFDRELYCGICAQQFPRSDEAWASAFRDVEAGSLAYVEQSLNRIGASKSGLDPAMRAGIARAVDAFAALRLRREGARDAMPEHEWVRWFKYACSYFAPLRA
ncbi:MAG: hypothetical protein HYX51_10775 [Chloroflexi bacterium]|nr:hypothetical protein [Chloroflexota bacterium]